MGQAADTTPSGTAEPPRRMSTAEATVETMLRNGTDTVFCLPGVQNDHLFDALHRAQPRVRVLHTRHEQGAAYMALGAAMATGRPSAYAVVPGPGFLNTTAALATAYACNAPVLCLSGQIASAAIGRGLGHLHEIPDQLGIMRGLTKWADRILAPHEGATKLAEAFRRLRSGRPRPVALECPLDIWPQQGMVSLPAGPASAEALPLDPDAIDAAAQLLAAAGRPLIVVGSGAQHAAAEVTALAEMLQAPVVSHRMGRGVVDSRNPLGVGLLAGHRLWARADVVLAIGSRLEMPLNQWGTDDGLSLIRIDVDPEEMQRVRRPDVAILADAAEAVRALARALPAGRRHRPGREEEILAARTEADARIATLQPQMGFLQAIRDVLPEDGIFVDELTQLGYAGRLGFPVYRPRTYLSPGYQGTLGWGVATALGAKAARPDATVLAITGDGGFMFGMAELATAVQHRLPVTIVLVNDGAFGNVRRIQAEAFGNRLIASDLTNPDFLALAASFGCLALRAASPDELRAALERGFASAHPAVIEIPAGAMPSPWPLLRPGRARPAR